MVDTEVIAGNGWREVILVGARWIFTSTQELNLILLTSFLQECFLGCLFCF